MSIILTVITFQNLFTKSALVLQKRLIANWITFIFHQEWIAGQIFNVSWSYIKEAFFSSSRLIYHWLRKILSFFNFLHRPLFLVLCLIVKELAKVTHIFYFFHTFFEFLDLLKFIDFIGWTINYMLWKCWF